MNINGGSKQVMYEIKIKRTQARAQTHARTLIPVQNVERKNAERTKCRKSQPNRYGLGHEP